MFLPFLCAFGFFLGVGLSSAHVSLFWPCIFFVILPLFFRKPVLLFVAVAFLFGVQRVAWYEDTLKNSFESGWQSVEGQVVEEVDAREDRLNLTVATEMGTLLVQASPFFDVHYGDWVRAQGVVEFPKISDGDVFSYSDYLKRYGVTAVMNRALVERVASGPASVRRALYAFKESVERRLNRLFPEPESSFAAGLLLGTRKGMPEDLTEAFQKVGLLHIVAISGSNITLVIALFFALFSSLSLRARVFVSAVGIALFVILVGASSTVIRAAVMGSLALWGLYLGRRTQALFGLLWSTVLLLLWNPYLLLYDVGFQLSVASTAGLLLVQPILKKWIPCRKHPLAVFVQDAFLLTLSAQIATFPLMAYYFGQISWTTPFANVLAAPLIPLAMAGAAVALMLPAFVFPAWIFLWFIEALAVFFSRLPFASLSLVFSVLNFWTFYGVFLISILIFYKSILVRAFLRGPLGFLSKE